MKILKKSKSNKVVFGVIGGLGEYFDIDPTIFRLIFIFLAIITGVVPMIIVYILGALIVPKISHE